MVNRIRMILNYKYIIFKMDGGISNKTVVRFFAKSANDDIKKTSLVFFLPTL